MATQGAKTSFGKFLAVDLFSGCGGLTVGLRRAGFRVVGAVELCPTAAEAYRENHRRTHLVASDIRGVNPSQFLQSIGLASGQLDLLAGCPPCQGFSSMRTLNGNRVVSDVRNDLVFDFLRFAVATFPKTILMENVPALAKDARLTQVMQVLRSTGYSVAVRVLDAADYGVPQRRRRMLLLASRVGPVEFPNPAPLRSTVRDAIGGLSPPGVTGDPLHDLPSKHSARVLELIRQIPKDGGSRRDLGVDNQLACHRTCSGFADVYGRMAWDAPAPTITSGCVNPSKGRFIHPEQHRPITLREAALLQGFPPNYKFPVERGKYPVAELIGNALPAEFVRRQVAGLCKLLVATRG